jgi:L,D-transpeptidase catalytic domain
MKIPSMLPLAFVSAIALSSCTNKVDTTDLTKSGGKTAFKNPYPAGTYENFTAEPSYPKTYNIFKNQEVLSQTNETNARIILDTAKQRAMLMNGEQVAMDYPISSGRGSHPTPKGNFAILEKTVDKASNTYGKIYDIDGKVVNSDADIRTDKIPEGGKFDGAPMKYWMRLTYDGVGHHIGKVPRYPASHGCIRGYYTAMPIVFGKVKVGTPVTVR